MLVGILSFATSEQNSMDRKKKLAMVKHLGIATLIPCTKVRATVAWGPTLLVVLPVYRRHSPSVLFVPPALPGDWRISVCVLNASSHCRYKLLLKSSNHSYIDNDHDHRRVARMMLSTRVGFSPMPAVYCHLIQLRWSYLWFTELRYHGLGDHGHVSRLTSTALRASSMSP